MKNYFYLKFWSLIGLAVMLFSPQVFATKNTDGTPIKGMLIGPNYVVWEAEATNSPLDKWEIIKAGDERYNDESEVPPIGGTHLEFTGNNKDAGPATSPLEYTFTCPKTGKYRLGARLLQRLEGEPEDKCNDVYIKMAGDFTSGNAVKTEYLEHNQKFYGRGVDKWGALFNLEIHETSVHSAAEYNLTEGQEYTITVSGRAQRTNIDYWLLYETSIPMVMEAHKDIATENPEEFRPPSITCKTFNAVDMKFTNIAGFTDAQTDNKSGTDILQITDRLAWAAAQLIYDGTDGEATFTLNSMQETDGESSYKVKINNVLIGEVTNDRIHGTTTPDYTIQSHTINDNAVTINKGDTIQIEFSNATNGLVPEGDLTATSRGRWVSLDLCTSGRFTNYSLKLNKEKFSLPPDETVKLEVEAKLPYDEDINLIWKSNDSKVATVDTKGGVTAINEGTTYIVVSTLSGKFKDSCEVFVVVPKPYNGEPSPIPGVIEVEEYDKGGNGATYNDSGAANEGGAFRTDDGVDIEDCTEGGYSIGWTEEGEWLKYSVDVKESGNYYFEIRIASMDAEGKFHIEIDEKDVSGTQSFSKTGGWQTWETVKVENIDLTKGNHSLKLAIESAGWNINWFRMYVTGATINATGVSVAESELKLEVGKSKSLIAEVLPDNASNKAITWSSLNPSIASVDENGEITAIAIGETSIIAESEDGGFSAICKVTITASTTSINDKTENLALVYPNPFKNTFTVKPTNSDKVNKVIIRNSLGQVVFEQEVFENEEVNINNSAQLNLKGFYLVEIIGENTTQTLTVIAE